MRVSSVTLLSITLIGAWVLLLLSFFLMKQALLLTDDLRGITIELIRDLIGLFILAIWVVAFYIIRRFVARRLLRA
ncbi:MAG: hypothetical protein ACP5LX_04640 [Nitrososphaeria archaeon]|jgi:lysylphosphatidylglycerol synthetase-like protein (DUF2156 family)